MKRKLIIPFLLCVFFSLFSIPTFAKTSENGYIQVLDDSSISDEDLSSMDESFDLFATSFNTYAYYVEVESDENLEEQANSYIPSDVENAFVLIVGPNEHKFVKTGECTKYLSVEDEDALWSEMNEYDSLYLRICTYWLKLYEVISSNFDEGKVILPEEHLKPRLVDDAKLLSSTEKQDLLKTLDEISERQQVDVAIVTTNGTGGRTIQQFADDYYDYNGYGMTNEDSGILLAVDMVNREWAFTTYGYGITAFTDAGMEYMEKKFVNYLSDGDFYGGFCKFASLCDEFITQAKTDKPYDKRNLPKAPFNPLFIVAAIVLAFGAAWIPIGIYRSQLKTVKPIGGAMQYIDDGGLVLTGYSDTFITSSVTRTPRPKSTSSSSGGGSSTHRSSSGRSHGGRSGRF